MNDNKHYGLHSDHQKTTKISYRFELELNQIMLNIPFGCKAFVEWGRKNLKTKSQCRLDKHPSKKQNLYQIKPFERLLLDQKISVHHNLSAGQHQNLIKIILQKNGIEKLGGSLKFNINEAIKGSLSQGKTKLNFCLENTPDQVSYLQFSIHYTKIQEVPNFYTSTGSFRSKSPSNISQSPESQAKRKGMITSPRTKNGHHLNRNVNFAPFQIHDQNPTQSHTVKSLKQAEMKIFQLITLITGFKNELHIKTKEVQMLKDNQLLQTKEIERERVEMNRKVLMTLGEVNQLETEFKRVKKENGLLQVEVQRLKMELIRSQKSRQRNELQSSSLKEKIQSMEENSKEENRFLKAENDRLKYENFQAQSRTFKLQQEYKSKIVANEDHSQLFTAKMSQLEQQNISLVGSMREMQQRLSEYEDRISELQAFGRDKGVEAQMLRQKLIKKQKSSIKDQQFSQSSYALLKEKYEMTAGQLQEKREILSNIRFQYEEVIKEKDRELQTMRKKFNSFIQKIQYDKS